MAATLGIRVVLHRVAQTRDVFTELKKKKPTADVLLFIGYYIVCGVQKWPADKQSLVHI